MINISENVRLLCEQVEEDWNRIHDTDYHISFHVADSYWTYIYIYKPQYSCVQIPPLEESKYCKCLLQWLWLHLFVIHILYMQMQGWYVYICEEQESPTRLLGQKLSMERVFAPLTSNSDCNWSPYLYCKQTTDK